MTATAGTRIAGDCRLLKFKSYEEYLDSLVTPIDMWYLRHSGLARQVAEQGYRSTGETVSKESFYKRLQEVKDLLYPAHRAYVLDSELTVFRDSLQRELALRERGNRLGALSTIIYVRQSTRLNYEISGYIDFAHRLISENWQPFFKGKRKIRARKNDLAYYDWRSGKTLLNSSTNYRPIVEKKRGLLFKNVHDGKFVAVDPFNDSPGVDSTRVRIYSDQYEHIVLYDHAVH